MNDRCFGEAIEILLFRIYCSIWVENTTILTFDLCPQATAPVSIPSSSSNSATLASTSFTPTNSSSFSISWQSPPVTFTGNTVRKLALHMQGQAFILSYVHSSVWVLKVTDLSALFRCLPAKARASVNNAHKPSLSSRPLPEPPLPSGTGSSLPAESYLTFPF